MSKTIGEVIDALELAKPDAQVVFSFGYGDIRFAVPNVAEGVGARPRHTPGTLRSHVLRSSVKQGTFAIGVSP